MNELLPLPVLPQIIIFWPLLIVKVKSRRAMASALLRQCAWVSFTFHPFEFNWNWNKTLTDMLR